MSRAIKTDLKILVIGSSGTGKTSFVQRWTKGEFSGNYKPTVVSEFGFKIFEYNNRTYRIQLWDIGGQDKSPSMAKIFARDSHGCVVLSDVTKKETLQNTLNWKKVVSDESKFVDGEKLPFILIQNKIDLINDKNELEEIENETKNISENNEFAKYYMASVKENINVDESMQFLIANIIERLENYASVGNEVFEDQKQRETLQLDRNSSVRSRKKEKCC